MPLPDVEKKAIGPVSESGRSSWAFVVKVVLTLGLMTWLVQGGALDFSQLRLLVGNLKVLLIALGAWLFLIVFLSAARWRMLLQLVGVEVPWLRAVALQVVALFFNAVVPGGIGGDFLKNHTLLGNQPGRIAGIVLIERALGVATLVWVSLFGIVLSAESLAESRALMTLAGVCLLLVLGSILGPWLLLRFLPEEFKEVSEKHEEGSFRAKLRSALFGFIESLKIVQLSPPTIARVTAVSFLMHAGLTFCFFLLTRHLNNPDAALSQIALVYPLGMLTFVLPVSVSGMGVGHVAFDQLFSVVGLRSGANVFNLFVFAQLVPVTLGALLFLFLKDPRKSSVAPAERRKNLRSVT